MSGLAWRRASKPSPKRSITPGRKFSRTRSLTLTKASANSTALGSFRFRRTESLLALTCSKLEGGLPYIVWVRRVMSNRAKLSTLITWAPSSASISPANGPAAWTEKSATRMPERGPVFNSEFTVKSHPPGQDQSGLGRCIPKIGRSHGYAHPAWAPAR